MSAVTYESTPDGSFVTASGVRGVIRATVHRPLGGTPWRLCYASCGGGASHLTGKTIDARTLNAIKSLIESQAKNLDKEWE